MDVFMIRFFILWFSLTLSGSGATAKIKLTLPMTNISFSYGILNINHNGRWGTVCDDGWDSNATDVACRQLGYSKGVASINMGHGTGQIWLDNVSCNGTESSLDECRHIGWGVHDCGHTEDVGLICQAVIYSVVVRLSGGSNPKEGRVEVRYNNIWGTICDDGWNLNNANVICKMLGYQRALKIKKFGRGSGEIWLDDVSCTGSEASIDKCRHGGWGIHDCSHMEDTGVICLQGSPDVAVRFAGGLNGGRVEVRYYGDWKSICDSSWDINDANVVCKMLGYSQGAAGVVRNYKSSQPVWLSIVTCNGNEVSIANCKGLNWGQESCGNNKRARVLCKSGSSFVHFSLSNGDASNGGRLTMRYFGTQGTICADNFHLQNAHVVCRMMGYTQAVTVYKQQNPDNIYIFSLLMNCDGREASIQQCGYRIYEVNACISNNVVWIVCRPTVSPKTQIRLQGRLSRMEGHVEIQQYGIWGTICNSGWDIRDANVVCRMLNYKGAIRIYTQGGGSGPIWLTRLRCKGDETDILNCTHSGLGQTQSCIHDNDAAVACHSYPDIEVRLAGGVLPYSGRVEVKFNGIWGTICGNYWTINEANVICRMLNYQQAIAGIRYFGGGIGKIWLRDVHCTENEKSLESCGHSGWDRYTCGHDADVGVICNASSVSNGPDVAVRLADGRTPNKGRVEVRYYGVWGTVCGHFWGWANAHVVCRMLNYSKALWYGTIHVSGGIPILLDDVRCYGNEKSLEYCQHRSLGQHNCGHHSDVGVRCGNLTKDEASVMVRLVKNVQKLFGQVEVKYQGTWRPVCDDTWDISDAHVVCRMLGYKAALAAVKRYSRGRAGVWFGGVFCGGTEKSISECYHRSWSNRQCNGYFTAAALCQHSDGFSEVEIRLENGGSPNSGRVAVRYGNVWGTICNRGLDINDAKVICRMLGYPGASKVYMVSRTGNGTIWLNNLECKGTERSIVDCQHQEWGQTTCGRDYDAGVVCEKAGVPRFHVNDSYSVSESTVILTIGAMGAMDEALNSSYQIVVQKVQQNFICNSMDQTLPSMIDHFAMATKNGSSLYVTAEFEYTTSPFNLTVGDGLEYNGYYNAPLEKGCVYKVYLRVVTRTSTGRNVYGDSSFVAFTTKSSTDQGARADKGFTVEGNVVIALAIALVICIAVLIGCINMLHKQRKKKPDDRGKPQGNEEFEMSSAHAQMYGHTERHYQPLLRLSPPKTEESLESLYAKVSDTDSKEPQSSSATSSGDKSTCKKEETLYENVDGLGTKRRPYY